MPDNVFAALPSSRIAWQIKAANRRVVYVAPGIANTVAAAMVAFAKKPGAEMLEVVVDCNDDVCRLGYGDIKAVRDLVDAGVEVRQSLGVRIGLLICDDQAWCFSPIALSVEDEAQSDETPNAVSVTPQQAEYFVFAVCPERKAQRSLFDRQTPDTGAPQAESVQTRREIGIAPLQKNELAQTEKSLEIAPPLKFDVTRKVRVFQPYLQYVELSLQGCSISRHKVQVPQEILNLTPSKTVRERLRTTYNLIRDNSKVSDKPLQDELEQIRKDYTRHLGGQMGRVMLRSKRTELDKKVVQFRKKLEKHQETIKKRLHLEIERSVKDIIGATVRHVLRNPPAEFLREIPNEKPTQDQAERWLRWKLDSCFPTAEQLVSDMEFECSFKDVTYETLNEPGFWAAIKKAYPAVDWDKPYNEFDAAREKQTVAR